MGGHQAAAAAAFRDRFYFLFKQSRFSRTASRIQSSASFLHSSVCSVHSFSLRG
jgi:hypothetical protein